MHEDLSLVTFLTLKKTSSMCRQKREDDTVGTKRKQ